MESVNEQTTSYLDVTFRDRDGTPSSPSSATYTVTDAATGTVLRTATAINPIAAQVTITLTPEDNTIVNAAKKAEIRIVTIESTYGASDELNDEFRYELVNLNVVT